MKNYKRFISLAAACIAFTTVFAGCDKISTTTELPQSTENSVSETTEVSSEILEASAVQTVSSIDELNETVGFTAYSIDSEAYEPVSYDVIDENIAQITYNHDGNTATLRVSANETDNLSDVTGTENAESYSISDYDLEIDVQESDNKYVAEWSAVDKDGNTMYFSLVEDNIDIAVFENTLSTYANTALNSDQSVSSEDSEAETDENGETTVNSDNSEDSEGEVVATCEDNTVTYEYEIKEDGTYEFTDPVSDANTYWDIYVLDEQWDDGTRYIKQSYDSQGQTPVTLKLTKGQWVYCFCSSDSFNSDEPIDCKLTITKK